MQKHTYAVCHLEQPIVRPCRQSDIGMNEATQINIKQVHLQSFAERLWVLMLRVGVDAGGSVASCTACGCPNEHCYERPD